MRQYLIGSWANADEYDYSGEQLMGNRLGASREVPHFTASGKANVAKYGDNTEKKGPTISIKDRILPQAKRLTTLREQMVELENSYRSGEMDIQEYSLLRDLIVVKIDRATELYKKAVTKRPIRPETYEDSAEIYTETFSTSSDNNGHGESYSSPVGVGFFAEVVDELGDQNSFKSFLKSACLVTRTLVRWSQQAAAYYRTLKEV